MDPNGENVPSMPHAASNKPFDAPRSLRSQAITGGFWAAILQSSVAILRVARGVVLANLLAPRDFGIAAIGLIAISLLKIFSEFGFDLALIRKKGNVDDYVDTAWSFGVVRGFVIALVLFFGAPLVSGFFNEPDAQPVIRILALSPFLSGLRNMRTFLFRRDLKFKSELLYKLSSEVTGTVVGVSLAILYRNAWALVGFILAKDLAMTVLSYIMIRSRSRFSFDKARLSELMRFGKWLLPSGVLEFLSLEGDDSYVGRFLDVATMGLYRMAFTLSNSVVDVAAKSISSVSFPALSKVQSDKSRLKQGFNASIAVTSGITFPLIFGIAFLSPIAIPLILGEKWRPIIWPTIILCVGAIIRANTPSALLLSVGRTRHLMTRSLVRTAAMFAVIFPLGHLLGIVGVAIAVVVGRVADIPIWLHYSADAIDDSITSILKQFLPALMASFLMGAVVLAGLIFLRPMGVMDLIVLIFAGATVYFLAQWIMRRGILAGFLHHLHNE